MAFFSNLFRRDASHKSRKHAAPGKEVAPVGPRWEEAWSRKEVTPEEVQELIHECSQEMKSRGEHATLYNSRAETKLKLQLWICPSCFYHFVLAQIPLALRALFAISLGYNMKEHGARTSNPLNKSFGLWIRW
jgi:hypothetical protein